MMTKDWNSCIFVYGKVYNQIGGMISTIKFFLIIPI